MAAIHVKIKQGEILSRPMAAIYTRIFGVYRGDLTMSGTFLFCAAHRKDLLQLRDYLQMSSIFKKGTCHVTVSWAKLCNLPCEWVRDHL